jgi:hypothetical protein
MREKWILRLTLLGAIIVLISVSGAYLYLHRAQKTHFDPLIEAVIRHAAQVSTYAQYVETRQVSQAGILQINGEYLVDDTHQNYSAFSTTTYKHTGGSPVVFQLENRAIASDVYVRIINKSPLVRLSVPADGTWQHFPATNIPTIYQNIAVAGPVIDDLKLLGSAGDYLVQDTNHGMTSFGGTNFIRYTFKLSRLAELSSDAGVRTIASRVGPTGLIDLWIDASSTEVAHMRLTNGSTYTSTTTFSRLNEPLNIKAPTSR